MSYVHGHSICCAQGAGAALWPQWAAPLPAASVPFAFLGQTAHAAYFRAFAEPRLSLAALADLIEIHLQAAAADAGWSAAQQAEAAVFIGSTAYNMADCEQRYLAGAPDALSYTLHTITAELMKRLGHEQIYSFATSCTSSAHALMHAHRLLQSGLIKRALVVGVESFNLLTLAHFHATGLLAVECTPFAGQGFVLGEGIACLALAGEAPPAGGLRLCGVAAGSGGGSLTDTDSQRMAAVMQHALAQAEVPAAALKLVKAHAVGSADSDEAERQALMAVVGQAVPVAWFKPHIGHTLGASGAIETALLRQSLQTGTLPSALAGRAVAGLRAASADMALAPGHYLAQFAGFGGSHISMVWGWQPC